MARKATKTTLVDFIHHNFTKNGQKVPKAELNGKSLEYLKEIIARNNCQQRLEEWLNKPKLIKYMVDGTENEKEVSWDCEYVSEEECRKAFENEGITVIRIAPSAGHHRCKYCKGIADGADKDLLCEDCQEMFGHTFYHEL